MAAKKDRLAAKQIHASDAVLGLRDEGEPRGARGAWMFRAVMSCEDPTDDILIDLHGECMRDLLSDALITESGVAKLHLEDGRDDFLSVNPSTNRSIVVRDGARRRERRLIISWCLSNTDSAMTDRTPPGRVSLARVTSNCTARRSKSRIVGAGYQGYRSAQDCPYAGSHAMIGEFAPHTLHGTNFSPAIRLSVGVLVLSLIIVISGLKARAAELASLKLPGLPRS